MPDAGTQEGGAQNEDVEDDDEDDGIGEWKTVTRKGRGHRAKSTPYHFKDYVMLSAAVNDSNLYDVLQDDHPVLNDYHDNESQAPPPTRREVACVGAGIINIININHTTEMQVVDHRKAMSSQDRVQWLAAYMHEYRKMVELNVFRALKKTDLPPHAKAISTRWVNKKKANGTFRSRLVMRGYEQIPEVHYNSAWTHAPVTTDITIRILLVLLLMSNGYAHVVDVQSAFLLGEFANGEALYCPVPPGWTHLFPQDVVLLLMKTVYGLKQAANCFYRLLCRVMALLFLTKSRADPCLFYRWDAVHGLCAIISWCDDLCCFGAKPAVLQTISNIKNHFEVDDVGPLHEYLGCIIAFSDDRSSCKITQPVLIKRLSDEFAPTGVESHATPAAAGVLLSRAAVGGESTPQAQTEYRQLTGLQLFVGRWSRPESLNAIREASRQSKNSTPWHRRYANRITKYLIDTPNRGWYLKPKRKWDGKDKNFKFRLHAKSDSNYATCRDTRKSVTGYAVYLEGAMVAAKSGLHPERYHCIEHKES